MKPAAFKYFAPRGVEEALALLVAHGEDGKVLAGGQSLVPAMNFRLARPAALIDINRIAALDYLREEGGTLRIGALARHARFETPVAGGALGGFLPRIARHIAHFPIRARGTFCGSLAHADPASEWCLVAATLDAEFVVASQHRTRVLGPGDYFVGALTTTLEPDELLTETRLPLLDDRWRSGFAEFSRRTGDYALAMTAAFLRIEDGCVVEARVGIGGAAECPARIEAAEAALVGSDGGLEARRQAGALAAAAIEPLEDVQAGADYRRHLVRAMVERALTQAMAIEAAAA
ncbi:MAG TPA: FAD binding domain-containing protein [Stellaceae bacterium]|nr:FAD binding domain-containing protein [Stellaceae bacterium]